MVNTPNGVGNWEAATNTTDTGETPEAKRRHCNSSTHKAGAEGCRFSSTSSPTHKLCGQIVGAGDALKGLCSGASPFASAARSYWAGHCPLCGNGPCP